MSSGAYLAGVAFLLPTLAATLAAAVVVVSRRFPVLSGGTRALAGSVFFTLGLILCGVVPAFFGALTRGTSLLTACLLVAASLALPRSAGDGPGEPPVQSPPSSQASIVIAALALGAIGIYEFAHLATVLASPVTDVDLLTFHLPGVARFIQTGTVWMVDQFMPGYATAQYPNNGDFVLLASVLPWHSFAFARLPAVGYYCLTGAGVFRLSLELGSTRAAATTFAAVLLSVPAVAGFSLNGLPDPISLAMLAIGLTFVLRCRRNGRRSELLLAGLALGLSLGTKWYGLTAVAVVIVVWMIQLAIAHAPAVAVRLRSVAIMIAGVLLAGGFWLLRNLIESGDPLYPKAISVFGITVFQGSHGDAVDRTGYTLASYFTDFGVLRRYVYPGFKVLVGFAGLVLVAGLLIAIVRGIALRRRAVPGSQGETLLVLAAMMIGICVVYSITPGSAYGPRGAPIDTFVNIRWLMPALVVGAALAAASVTTIGCWGIALEFAALPAVADGIRHAPGLRTTPASIALAIILAATVTTVTVRASPRLRREIGRFRYSLAALVLAGLALGGYFDQRSYERAGYARYDPVFAWIQRHANGGFRVGLAGSTASGLGDVLPLFGPRLRNTVTYVGVPSRHSLELPQNESSFASELRQSHDQLLVVGLQQDGGTDAWARELGYRLIVSSPNLALFAAPGYDLHSPA